jgi:dehydrogenase/reductase SDR family member 7B
MLRPSLIVVCSFNDVYRKLSLFLCAEESMKTFYKHKTVWITGASSGIGKALAVILSSYGTTLILSSENETQLLGVKEICEIKGAKVDAYVLDQFDAKMVETIASQIIEKHPSLNVLILNAGISQRATVMETELHVHDRIIQVNYRSNVQIIKLLMPGLLANGSCHIGVTSSISGKFGFPLRSVYAASKHALHGFFESLGLEYRKKGVYVTIVCPGRVKTSISAHALHGDGTAHRKMDQGQALGISPEKCAIKYLKAFKNRKREKLIGGKELFMAYFKRYCPVLFFKIAEKINPY